MKNKTRRLPKRAPKDLVYKLLAVAEMKRARAEFVRRIGKIMKACDLYLVQDADEGFGRSRGVRETAAQMLANTVSMKGTAARDREFAEFDLATKAQAARIRAGDESWYK